MNRRRNVILGGCLLAAIALLGVAQARLDAVAATQSVRAPRFEVDPYWPKPIPNGWIYGNVIGVTVDAQGQLDLSKAYAILGQIAPLILAHQGKGEMTGILLDEKNPSSTVEMGGYRLEISLDEVFTFKAKRGHGLVISLGNDEFLAAGTGFRVGFSPLPPAGGLVGLGPIDEGTFSNGKWIPGRRLNGDETDQGRRWRISSGYRSSTPVIQRCTVYRYE